MPGSSRRVPLNDELGDSGPVSFLYPFVIASLHFYLFNLEAESCYVAAVALFS